MTQLEALTYRDEQNIVRWKSNSQIPQPHVLALFEFTPGEFLRHAGAREQDLQSFHTAHVLHRCKRGGEDRPHSDMCVT